MNRTLRDAKRLLLGQDGSENTPLDFKEEIVNSIKDNIITKAMATLLLTARNNVDNLGKSIVKKQESDISGKGSRVSKKEFKEIIDNEEKVENKKEDIKRQKEEKRKREESLRQTMQRIAEEDERREDNINFKHKEK